MENRIRDIVNAKCSFYRGNEFDSEAARKEELIAAYTKWMGSQNVKENTDPIVLSPTQNRR